MKILLDTLTFWHRIGEFLVALGERAQGHLEVLNLLRASFIDKQGEPGVDATDLFRSLGIGIRIVTYNTTLVDRDGNPAFTYEEDTLGSARIGMTKHREAANIAAQLDQHGCSKSLGRDKINEFIDNFARLNRLNYYETMFGAILTPTASNP